MSTDIGNGIDGLYGQTNIYFECASSILGTISTSHLEVDGMENQKKTLKTYRRTKAEEIT